MTARKPGIWSKCWCGRRIKADKVECHECRKKKGLTKRPKYRNIDEEYIVKDGTENRNPGFRVTLTAGGKETEVQATLLPTSRKHQELARRFRRMALRAYRRALKHGHDMEPLQEDDGLATYVAMCWTCERYLVFDPIESRHAYGKVTEGECPGRVVWAVARRRSEFERDTAQAVPALEPLEGIEVGHTRIAESDVLNTGQTYSRTWVDQE